MNAMMLSVLCAAAISFSLAWLLARLLVAALLLCVPRSADEPQPMPLIRLAPTGAGGVCAPLPPSAAAP